MWSILNWRFIDFYKSYISTTHYTTTYSIYNWCSSSTDKSCVDKIYFTKETEEFGGELPGFVVEHEQLTTCYLPGKAHLADKYADFSHISANQLPSVSYLKQTHWVKSLK